MLMPTIQSAELWREIVRYDYYCKENAYLIQARTALARHLYGPPQRDMITDIFRAYGARHSDLPHAISTTSMAISATGGGRASG